MYIDDILSEAEEIEIINKIANLFHQNGLDTAAILLLETVKPLVYIGGEMSRIFFLPFFSIAGNEADILGQKMINIFEKKENVERLIRRIEENRKN